MTPLTITISISAVLIILAFFSGRNYGFDIGYNQGRNDGELAGAEHLWNELVKTKEKIQ